MSSALTQHSPPDTSSLSAGTQLDLSLGGLASLSMSSFPSQHRVPSASSGTTAPSSVPVSTPDPSPPPLSRRKTITARDRDGDGLLNTPGDKNTRHRWNDEDEDGGGSEVADTPVATSSRPKRTTRASAGKGGALTLRDQEKVSLRFSCVMNDIYIYIYSFNIQILTAHRFTKEGKLQHQAPCSFPGRASGSARPRPD